MKTVAICVALLIVGVQAAAGQVYRLAEMNTRQIAALDVQKTAIIMPGGTMEEHGPYLPAFTDGFMNEWWAERLAEAIVARPGWKAVIYPTLPIGDGGANEIAGKFSYPGTYGVRLKTLRAVYMDLGTELGEQGFRWIFVLQNHGSPLHNFALDQAGDFFHDTYGGQMVNLMGLEPEDSRNEERLSPEIKRENGIDLHAGLSETSRILFIKPNLVDAAYLSARSFPIPSPDKLWAVASTPDWPGYFGAPSKATRAYGVYVMNFRSNWANKTAIGILDGADPKAITRYADQMMKRDPTGGKGPLAYDDKVEKKQQDWITKKALAW